MNKANKRIRLENKHSGVKKGKKGGVKKERGEKKKDLSQVRTLDLFLPFKAMRNKKNNPYRDSVFGIG